MMFFLLGLSACLVNHELYEERRLSLTDADQDGFAAEVDCQDDDPTVHPDATEQCNGVDDDCDGAIDEAPASTARLYRDADGDGFGDPGDQVEDCPGTSGWVEVAGDCDDGDAAVHPDAEEIAYDGVDNDCSDGDAADLDGDGHDAVAAGGGDCDDADASVHPEAAETWGDGATDNDCDGDYGAATLEYGATAWTGEAAGDNAGRRVSALGDVSGDGLAEFVVAAPFHGSVHEAGGAVYVVSGGEPGPLGEEGVIDAGGRDWYLGSALAGGEDLDDDGVADLLVTATGWDDGRGAAWFLSGADLPGEGERVAVDDLAAWSIQGTEDGAYLGSSVAMLGDIDGDGVGDVGVGAAFSSAGGLSEAGAVGFYSSMDGEAAFEDADRQLLGPFEGARLGARVEAAGDQDGDGYGDVLVGYGGGVVGVLLAGGVDVEIDPEDDALCTFFVDDVEQVGEVEMVGDVDGDGASDAAVVIDNYDVYVFSDLASSPSRSPVTARSVIELDGDAYVFDLQDVGDLDQDGRDDLLVPAKWYSPVGGAAATLVWGAQLEPGARVGFSEGELRAVSSRASADLGYRVAMAGFVDGDEVRDLVMAGSGDDAVGDNAGAVALLPLPR